MKNKLLHINYYYILLFILCVISFNSIEAKDKSSGSSKRHSFWINFDKKVIYVDSLGLPSSDNVQSVIRLLPELLQRPGYSLSTYYDVKMNGMSLGNDYDAVMDELQIADVDRIEVCESPLSTYNTGGQSGSIDIILKESCNYKKDPKDKLWGSAAIGVRYPTKLTPYFQLNYKAEKFSVQGLFVGEYNNKSNESTVTKSSDVTTTKDWLRKGDQLVGIYMKYNPSEKDAFAFKVMESFTYNRDKVTNKSVSNNATSNSFSDDTINTTQVRALINYQRTFSSKLKLEVETQYSYVGTRDYGKDDLFYLTERDHVNSISGSAKLQWKAFRNGKNYGDLKVGTDYSFSFDRKLYYGIENRTGLDGDMSTDGCTNYVMPFINWECRYKHFLLQAQGELQHYKFKIKAGGLNQADYSRNDFTGSIIMEQQLGTPHHIRLILRRKLQRPTLSQVYPYPIAYTTEQMISIGNSEMKPMLLDEVSLDYISRYSFGDHHFTIDVNANYNHISDVISTVPLSLEGYEDIYGGYSYQTYKNYGFSNVVSGNLMVFYKYRSFSLSLTGNIYHKYVNDVEGCKTSNYYNISIMPAFRLPYGWSSSLFVAYHSKVRNTKNELGECAYTQLNVSKSFGKCNVFFYQKSSFSGDVKDITYSSDGFNTEKKHSLILSTVGLGVQYRF